MGSIIVDSGAGTTDVARIVGRFPEDDDQLTIPEAGDWVDIELMKAIEKKYTGAQITKIWLEDGKKRTRMLVVKPKRFLLTCLLKVKVKE